MFSGITDNQKAVLDRINGETDNTRKLQLLQSTDWRTPQERRMLNSETDGFVLTELQKQIEVGRQLGLFAR